MSSLMYRVHIHNNKVFLIQSCERERRERGREKKRKAGEQMRSARRQAHLQRALATPPPRPI